MQKFTNCIVPDGGYPTQDGYLRVLNKPRKLGGKLTMLHRLEWEKQKGSIPEGFEVDHMCKNRCCQNVNHMQLLNKSEHKSKDNAKRFLLRQLNVLRYINENRGLTLKQIAASTDETVNYVANVLRQYTEMRDYVVYYSD